MGILLLFFLEPKRFLMMMVVVPAKKSGLDIFWSYDKQKQIAVRPPPSRKFNSAEISKPMNLGVNFLFLCPSLSFYACFLMKVFAKFFFHVREEETISRDRRKRGGQAKRKKRSLIFLQVISYPEVFNFFFCIGMSMFFVAAEIVFR